MQKLILFDIDGTLVLHKSQDGITTWQRRVTSSIQEVFGVVPVPPDPFIYNGYVDKNLLWFLARDAGVPKRRFNQKFGQLAAIFHKKTRAYFENSGAHWYAIPDARSLVLSLIHQGTHAMGVLTGNIEANGWLKLESAELRDYFQFGVFSDDVDDRLELIRSAIPKSEEHFGHRFKGRDIIVIGDTKHDIRAGKHIGAYTIAVLTGITETRESLEKEHPDLLIDTLMDRKVLTLLGLN